MLRGEETGEEIMRKLVDHSGFVRGAVLFLVLLVVVVVGGMLYLTTRRGVDVADEAGKTVAEDLEQAAQTVRDTSEDAILTAKVKTALVLSKSVSAFDIDVDSDNGTVTLTGAVSSDEARAAVLDIARDTAGVLEVVDRIQVDPRVGT
jgi:osmotically-inducible protein OsmY